MLTAIKAYRAWSLSSKVLLLSSSCYLVAAIIFILVTSQLDLDKTTKKYHTQAEYFLDFVKGYVRNNPDFYITHNDYVNNFPGLLGLRIKRGEEGVVYKAQDASSRFDKYLLDKLPEQMGTVYEDRQVYVYALVEGIDLGEKLIVLGVFSKDIFTSAIQRKMILEIVVAAIVGFLFVFTIHNLLRTHYQSLEKLSESLDGVLEGKDVSYELETLSRVESETSSLAQTFSRIFSEVRDRELESKAKLIELQGEIEKRESLEVEKGALQRQLFHAQKMESIGQLAGGIAHDFNNILSSIIGYSKLLRSSIMESTGKIDVNRSIDYLDEVIKAGDRAKNLIGNMLSFSRGEIKPELKVEKLSPPRALNDSLAMLKSVLPSSLQLKPEVEMELPNIEVDSVSVHQILMNLLINARDAMEGQGVVDIALYLENTPFSCSSCHQHVIGSYVVFEVKDHGVGMTADQMVNIFEPFFSTKDVGKGTGMGLSIVHGILHDMGGHIQVNSTPGVGTSFKAYLPVAVENRDTVPLAQRSDQSNSKILLVDDDVPVANFIAHILENEDFKVDVFHDPVAALEVYRKNSESYSAILTDNMMPGMTGEQLVNKIRDFDQEIPIMICTGYRGQLSDGFIQSKKCNQIFDKPVDVEELVSAVAGFDVKP